MKITTFETAKVGDRGWSTTRGWGEITEIDDNATYPLTVKFDNGAYDTFNYGGYLFKSDIGQALFWDEVKIEAPEKPLPDLAKDTKVIVWDSNTTKTNRHFSHFNASGKIMCFIDGSTSWTTRIVMEWDSWELAE